MFKQIEDLLKQKIGLHAESVGSAAINRAVLERMNLTKITNVDCYWDYLIGSPTELQSLIDNVIVPETWFFRYPESFVAFARLIRDEWLPAHPGGVLRLLSVPCSTGEEPYSMAMALLDAGIPADRFKIDAVDISSRAIEQAQRAVYGKNSFRGGDLGYRDRYFDMAATGYCLQHSIKSPVRFLQGNLLAADFLSGREVYDVIFCRNVLIYFDRETQDQVIAMLARLVKKNGLLFVGAAETSLLFRHGFTSIKVPQTFAFRKAAISVPQPLSSLSAPAPGSTAIGTTAVAQPALRRLSQALEITSTTASRSSAQSSPHQVKPIRLVPSSKVDLEEAFQLADRGDFAQALTLCEKHLRTAGPSAQLFYLIGLVKDATGNLSEANFYYRRALYLNPGHSDAIIHLAYLLEKQGDVAGAKLLRERLMRKLCQRSVAS